MATFETTLPEKDEKNYYHPSTEDEIISLVKHAKTNKFHVRVRGAGHSMPQAIFTDPCSSDQVDVLESAPASNTVINILLDRYTDIISVNGKLVEVQAGIHLGRDPMDPRSTLENSLLYQLDKNYQLALGDLGGITHQTVSGFLTTGSSGGTLQYSVHENVHAMRFVDGNGDIVLVSRDDENPDDFHASLVSLGLLGVISTITFSCDPTFSIAGKQVGTLTKNAAVDLFSDTPVDCQKKGLTGFLKETGYARILWWPQKLHGDSRCFLHEDRVQIWQAERIENISETDRVPYKLFDNVEIMMLYSQVMTYLGNIQDMDQVHSIVQEKEMRFLELAINELQHRFPGADKDFLEVIARMLATVNQVFLSTLTTLTEALKPEPKDREECLPTMTTLAVKLMNMVDKNVEFVDFGYAGLPMDNTADDIIVPTMWTEIWVPLSRATEVTSALRDYFTKKTDDVEALKCTGMNAWELYTAKGSDAWLSMAYTDGNDEWQNGAFRVDPYWFIGMAQNFRSFYRPVWLLLKSKGIPFRLHWGKSFPEPNDTEITVDDLVTNQYPKLKGFLELRKRRDPDGIFLNSYWRHWLGIPADSPN